MDILGSEPWRNITLPELNSTGFKSWKSFGILCNLLHSEVSLTPEHDRSRRRSGRASSLVESLSLLSNAARKGGASGLMVERGTGAASHRKHADESFLPALADSLIAQEAAKARSGESQPAASLNPR